MSEHTKTPWEVSDARSVCNCALIVGGSGHEFGLIAEVTLDRDAVFIVKVVNNHEPLVATLRDFIDILDGAMSGFIPGCGSDVAWHKGKDERIANARALLSAVSSPGERQ